MESTMWTDERLGDRFDSIDSRFDSLDRSLERVDRDIRELRALMFQLWGTNTLAILATIATVIATNG
jgi:hypothetical protein